MSATFRACRAFSCAETRSKSQSSRSTRAHLRRGSVICSASDKAAASPLNTTRRNALQMGLGIGAGITVATPDVASARGDWYQPPMAATPLTIVITGANSGIGFQAARKLARAGHNVHMVCRTQQKAVQACASIEEGGSIAGSVTPHECNLASLASIRAFAADWKNSGAPIDVLCLNAGAQFTGKSTPPRTEDGFEISVGVNHLGHFLLANLLLPSVEASKSATPRIVVTTSEVHDPASPGGAVGAGATLGTLEGLRDGPRFAMVSGPSDPYDAEKAYKDSKLCNMLFALELSRRLAADGSRVKVNAFGPGLITRSNFFRDQNPLFVSLFDFAVNDVFKVAETVEGGGGCLAYMAVDPSLDGVGGVFYNNDLDGLPFLGGHAFKQTQPSVEARNEQEAALLWEYSTRLVGLPA